MTRASSVMDNGQALYMPPSMTQSILAMNNMKTEICRDPFDKIWLGVWLAWFSG